MKVCVMCVGCVLEILRDKEICEYRVITEFETI